MSRFRLTEAFSGGSQPHPVVVPRITEQLEAAWDEGRPSFVVDARATSLLNDEGLNLLVDEALRIGWRIGAMSTHLSTTDRVDMEAAMFVFVRPEFR